MPFDSQNKQAKSAPSIDNEVVHFTREEQFPNGSSHSTVQFDIIGDVYVDLLCYLPSSSSSSLALNGSDSTLLQPITIMAGGSTLNTATYLQYLQKHFSTPFPSTKDKQTDNPVKNLCYDVTVHSMFNPNDHYGRILTQHATNHNFRLQNGFDALPQLDDVGSTSEIPNGSSSTPHCIVMISSHPSLSTERTFLTHRGCATQMTIRHLFPSTPNDSVNDAMNPRTARHVHIAGFFCTPGFWSLQTANGSLVSSGTLLPFVLDVYKNQPSCLPTILSLVTQCDASQTWDMTVMCSILPYMHICIMNEHEALQMYTKNHFESHNTDSPPDDAAIVSFLTPYNPSTIFIITKGVKGAVAYRKGIRVASVSHTVDIHSIGTGSSEPVVDPTGAGDAFCAGFCHSLWQSIRPIHLVDKSSHLSVQACPNYAPSEYYWPSEESIQAALLLGCTLGTCSVSQRGASKPPTDPQLIWNVHKHYLVKNAERQR